MDESVICLEDSVYIDPSEVIDLSETLLDTPQNSRDDLLFQEFFMREKNKRNRRTRLRSALPSVVIDLSSESVIDLCKESGPTQSEKQMRRSTDLCCPICFEKYSDVQLKATICGHVFCSSCIEATVRETGTCPKCRKKLTLKSLIPLYL